MPPVPAVGLATVAHPATVLYVTIPFVTDRTTCPMVASTVAALAATLEIFTNLESS